MDFVIVNNSFSSVLSVMKNSSGSVTIFPPQDITKNPIYYSKEFMDLISKIIEKAKSLEITSLYISLRNKHSHLRKLLYKMGFESVSTMSRMTLDMQSVKPPYFPPPPAYVFRNFRDEDKEKWVMCAASAFNTTTRSTLANFEKYWLNDKNFDSKLHYVALDKKDQVVGILSCWYYPLKNEGFIKILAVHPQHRRKGIAKHLLSLGLLKLKEIGANMVSLDVSVSNYPALKLYKMFGFQEEGIVMRKLILKNFFSKERG